MSRRAISLSNELSLLMDSIHGVRSLTKQWIESFGMDEAIPHQVSALLVVLSERVRFIDRVVRGTIDPRLAWCPQNDAAAVYVEDEDVNLVAWSERKLARHHRAQWKRLKARLAKKSVARDSKASPEEGSP